MFITPFDMVDSEGLEPFDSCPLFYVARLEVLCGNTANKLFNELLFFPTELHPQINGADYETRTRTDSLEGYCSTLKLNLHLQSSFNI